jgi:uncharacterized protein YhjY with autotransporter beta-barrel domain
MPRGCGRGNEYKRRSLPWECNLTSGRSSLTSYAVGAELGWGFKVNEGSVSTPYAGLKHTSSRLASYAESQTASNSPSVMRLTVSS